MIFQNRLFLIAHENYGNKIRYSAYEQPNVFNGDDTGELFLGDKQELVAGGVIYNLFLSSGFEQLILCKSSETYRLYGDGPENWEIQQMSPNVGCVAPLSFAVCEITDVGENVKRNVAIWQAAHGFVKTDGATIDDSISDDIKIFFDRSGASRIAAHRIDDTVAWYDPDTQEYHALISSGAENQEKWGGSDTWNNETLENWGTD